MGSEKGLSKFLKSKMFTLLIILAALIIVFTVWSALLGKSFFTVDTLLSVVDLLVVTSFLAIGSGALLITGNMDLSVVSVGCVGGLFIVVAMKTWLLPWPVALIVTLVVCAAFGLINAVLVNEFNFQPFIATMATSSVFKGFQMLISWDAKTGAAQNFSYSNPFTKFLGTYELFGVIPFTVIIMIVAFIIYGVLLSKTKFGTTVYLVGGNPQAARLSGLNPKKASYILFANSAALSGFAGIVLAARTGQANQLALSSNMFTGLTAALLGGIAFGGGSGGMGGVFVGLLILNIFNKGMAIVNLDSYWAAAMQGVVLVVALSLDFSRAKKVTKIKKDTSQPEKIVETAGTGR
ncbi:ribose transport system permease protein [Sporobacter termitidis DSM 10068]|uniref:Autoinducer 2 import system permease protein LsrD n=1 Tax=Sporobacter termitidis DSM 10068 TaxID=1123282 RepID=A0A1M5UJN0_9FIRM|nr:ABC transporter permease [Sporobacter termitidis]SHH63036.1 ribose transport system permease protein [Sporobacter termitidis DSM 10068]